MEYKIIYAEGRCHNYANGSRDVNTWLKILKGEVITDIIRISKKGEPVSVMDRYLRRQETGGEEP